MEQEDALDVALDLLRSGELVAFPTDTVYGLGADAFKPESIEALFAVKERENSKAIAILASQVADLERITSDLTPQARRLAEKFWPGPLTLVLPRHPALPANLSPLATIGVRIPDHPVALRLLSMSGPLAVTSANLSGSSNACTAQEVFAQLSRRIPLILDGGRTPGGFPSTVVDCTSAQIKSAARRTDFSRYALECPGILSRIVIDHRQDFSPYL